MVQEDKIRTGWRALIIGLILIPINSMWIASGESVSTTVSLFYNVVFVLFIIVILNSLLKKWSPRQALNHGELLIIYVMLSVASAICGLDMMRILISVLVGPHWLATPENEFATLFHSTIPDWFAPRSFSAVKGYYEPLGRGVPWNVWVLRVREVRP